MSRLYLLWSLEKEQWWKPRALGYTPSVAGAGVFTEIEARHHERSGDAGREAGTHKGSVAVPLDTVEFQARTAIPDADARHSALHIFSEDPNARPR